MCPGRRRKKFGSSDSSHGCPQRRAEKKKLGGGGVVRGLIGGDLAPIMDPNYPIVSPVEAKIQVSEWLSRFIVN